MFLAVVATSQDFNSMTSLGVEIYFKTAQEQERQCGELENLNTWTTNTPQQVFHGQQQETYSCIPVEFALPFNIKANHSPRRRHSTV